LSQINPIYSFIGRSIISLTNIAAEHELQQATTLSSLDMSTISVFTYLFTYLLIYLFIHSFIHLFMFHLAIYSHQYSPSTGMFRHPAHIAKAFDHASSPAFVSCCSNHRHPTDTPTMVTACQQLPNSRASFGHPPFQRQCPQFGLHRVTGSSFLCRTSSQYKI
jgi:hypothetical protein